ncbi:hypothetical protein B0T26DRAFT_754066 [Lasiosphaeria miniovina]|uniref:FAD-binding domain-containing protein n=1 Tax=Lasiosphaeria miniovina TaxID=1954250 RepID=A0AA40DUM0_9PEZI|nr:uncharacterized protein B0T26DRAFT_754066 [Lasiosphaeria miniovina]KAK0714022.1 hypothetical protein B0T26DRAFT_754066 [Lasiosphaeria miniovina]
MAAPRRRPLRVLISGGGIAGPALALWLSRISPAALECDITIVEKHATLRSNGQQIDLRDQGIDAVRRLGIFDAVRARVVHEPGIELRGRAGRRVAYFAANTSGSGRQSFSSEFEIMRGDLCEILYDGTLAAAATTAHAVRYVFDCTVASFTQTPDAVRVRLSGPGAGTPAATAAGDEFDVLVGADGIGSRVRRQLMPLLDAHQLNSNQLNSNDDAGSRDAADRAVRVPLGWAVAFFSIPARAGDPVAATATHLPGRRVIITRKDAPDSLRVYLSLGSKPDDGGDVAARRLDAVIKTGSVAEQKRAWADLFAPAAEATAQLPRYLDALLHSPVADDFYTQLLGQVRAEAWSKGRVVLLGDAGYCPSPLSGLGTTVAIVGAGVLAGELVKACGAGSDAGGDDGPGQGVPAALAAYERELRPFIKTSQETHFAGPLLAMPATAWGISVLHWLAWLAMAARVDKIAAWLQGPPKYKWNMPEYPELGSGGGNAG